MKSLKILLLTFAIAFLSPIVSKSAIVLPTYNSVVIGWNPITDPLVVLINVYYGTNSGTYFGEQSVSNTTNQITIINLSLPLYFFAAQTEYSNNTLSKFSNEIYWLNTPDLKIHNPHYTITSGNIIFSFSVTNNGYECVVQSTTNLANAVWINAYTNVTPFTFTETNKLGATKFYRLYYPPVYL